MQDWLINVESLKGAEKKAKGKRMSDAGSWDGKGSHSDDEKTSGNNTKYTT